MEKIEFKSCGDARGLYAEMDYNISHAEEEEFTSAEVEQMKEIKSQARDFLYANDEGV